MRIVAMAELGLGLFAGATLAACAGLVIAGFTVARRKAQLASLSDEKSALEAELDAARAALQSVESASGAFAWRCDAEGRLVGVSAALAERLGRKTIALEKRPLVTLVGGASDDLRARLDARAPFENCRVLLGSRPWSLSGRPQTAADGRFAGFVGVGAAITELTAAETDTLTGLIARADFEARALGALAIRRHQGEWSGLLRIEIGRLDEINESLGREVGDKLLRLAAKRLKSSLGEEALIARLGGASFAALTVGAERGGGARDAAAVAVALAAPFEIDGFDVPCSATVGLAVVPADGEDYLGLMNRAELARLRAKQDRAGGWRRYEPALDTAAQARRQLESDLRQARAQGRLVLFYQPLVEVATGRIKGFEALMRWRHPTLGLVGAQDFLPIAEETGLIGALGEWALGEACRQAALWPEDIRIAVNVSPLQLRSGLLVDEVAAALKKTGLTPGRLEIEITEGVLIADRDHAQRELDRLKQLGVRIALDDFGAGYASFGYLCAFPFDKIKVDQSFLRDMTARPGNAVVLKSIVTLAADLGLSLIVEGVDSPEQREWLIANGCREAQGYLFGRPMPAEEAERLLGAPRAARNAAA
jgi:diguanylate cyclase (GGDEF)-like protein